MPVVEPTNNRPSRGRIGTKLVLSFVLLVMVVVGSSGWVLFQLIERSLKQQMSQQLVAAARLVTTALMVTCCDVCSRATRISGLPVAQRPVGARKGNGGARRIYAFDRSRRSLLDTEGEVHIGREYPHLRIRDRLELEQVWNGKPAHSVLFEGEDGITYMTGYAPRVVGDRIVAAVGVDIGAAYVDTIRVFKRRFISSPAWAALLTVVVGLILARTITRPIQKLVAAARGNRSRSAPAGGGFVRPRRDRVTWAKPWKRCARNCWRATRSCGRCWPGSPTRSAIPLGSIELYTGLIADDLPDDDPRRIHIQKVIGEVRNLDHVISEFLEFAPPRASGAGADLIGRLVDDAAFLLAPEMKQAGVQYYQDVTRTWTLS